MTQHCRQRWSETGVTTARLALKINILILANHAAYNRICGASKAGLTPNSHHFFDDRSNPQLREGRSSTVILSAAMQVHWQPQAHSQRRLLSTGRMCRWHRDKCRFIPVEPYYSSFVSEVCALRRTALEESTMKWCGNSKGRKTHGFTQEKHISF